MKSLFFILVFLLLSYENKAQVTSNKIEKDSVISVSVLGDSSQHESLFGHKIVLKTKGFDSLLKIHEDIILFVDDIPVNSCIAKPSIFNRKNLIFDLSDTTVINEIWNYHYIPNQNKRTFTFSAGIKGGEPLPSRKSNFTIVFYSKSWLYGAYAVMIAMLVVFYVLSTQTRMIKDPSDNINPPFSLSRFQLALWTFIIVSSFIYIWIIKNYIDTLNATALILLGISAVTAISGTIITNTQKNLDTTNTIQTKSSSGFWLDILSDEVGVSVHRFQNVLFNFILGFIFLQGVYEYLFMPIFNDTLLTLMGISAGTYAALKATENRTLTNMQPSLNSKKSEPSTPTPPSSSPPPSPTDTASPDTKPKEDDDLVVVDENATDQQQIPG